jgi:hypothetical protein
MKIKYGRKWMLGLLPRGYFTVASIVEVKEMKPFECDSRRE